MREVKKKETRRAEKGNRDLCVFLGKGVGGTNYTSVQTLTSHAPWQFPNISRLIPILWSHAYEESEGETAIRLAQLVGLFLYEKLTKNKQNFDFEDTPSTRKVWPLVGDGTEDGIKDKYLL